MTQRGKTQGRRPEAPKVGDYILTPGAVIEDWWRIGLLGGGEDRIYATHTKAPAIRIFDPAALSFKGYTSRGNTPMWQVNK